MGMKSEHMVSDEIQRQLEDLVESIKIKKLLLQKDRQIKVDGKKLNKQMASIEANKRLKEIWK